MESCEYTQVLTDAGIGILKHDKSAWKPLLRQTIICLGVCCAYFMLGMFLGAPTVIVEQIRRDINSTEVITDKILPWLTSSMVVTSAPFVIILPLLSNRFGRKLTFLFVWLCLSVGYLILYNSTQLNHIIISESFAGIGSASAVTITPILVVEYTSPQYRGIFLTLKSASIFWGVWVSNAVGTFFPWRNIAIIPFICSVYILTIFLWPESPHWLAMKGRYAECAKSHRWLKGVNENSEKELAQLITSERKKNSLHSTLSRTVCSSLRDIWSTIRSRPFYKPALLSLTLFEQYQFTGKLVISMYALEVLKQLVQDENFVYIIMLILDGVTVLSMYGGCILSGYCKRRTMLMTSSVTAILLLYILSVYAYLVYLSVLNENRFIVLTLLSAYSIAIGLGPIILVATIYGEIISIRYERITMIFLGSATTIISSILLVLSPSMFSALKMHGSFLFFAVSSTFFSSILYIYLPETKDKTVQEIEEYFVETKPSIQEQTKSTEPSKNLLSQTN